MDVSFAIDKLRSIEVALTRRGVAHVAVFGSVARGEADGESDIDVFVAPNDGRGLSLLDMGAVQEALEGAFAGRAVDVVFAPVKDATLRAAIEREADYAF
jgi:predicted nucleotidyltransferase